MNYNLVLSSQMLEVIAGLLDRAPHGIARPIIDEIQRQVMQQNQAMNKAPPMKEVA